MKKRDLMTPIGITIGFMTIMFAILVNAGISGAALFIDIASIFIVLGGTVASLVVTFNKKQLLTSFKVLKEAFKQSDSHIPDLVRLFIRLADRARREGMLALESELDDIEDPFIRKGMMLAVDGIEPEVIQDILDAEINAMEERHAQGRSIFERAGSYAPSWGMIGTFIGLVLMLNTLSTPETLGPQMALAIITTLYGAVLAYLFFLPMAHKLEQKTDEEVLVKEIIIEGIIGIQSGQNPRILEEKLSAFLPPGTELYPVEEEDESLENPVGGDRLNEA